MFTINYASASGLFREMPGAFNGPLGGFGIELDLTSDSDRCEFGYPAHASGRSLNGDRSCDHVNLKGNLFANDPTLRAGTVLYGVPNSEWNVTFPGYSSGIPYLRIKPGTWKAPNNPRTPYYWGGYDEILEFQVSFELSDTRMFVKASWIVSTDARPAPFREPRSYREVWWEAQCVSGSFIRTSDQTVAVTWKDRSKTPHYATPTGWSAPWTKNWYRYGNLPDFGDAEGERLIAQVCHFAGLLGGDLPAYPDNFVDGVKVDAIEACKVVKINTLALLVDLKNIKSVATWAREIPRIRKLSQAARAYLGYKYGAPLTAADVTKMVASLSKLGHKRTWNGRSISRSRGVCTAPSMLVPGCSWKREYNVKLYYTPIDDLARTTFRSLADFGLFPTRKNLWDLIPYSFTLDWVVNVSDYLDAADAEDYLHTLSIQGVVQSSRDSITIPGSAISAGLSGELEVIFYSRSVLPTLSLDLPSLQISNPSNHLLEGGALISARTKF